jgi:translation initiation factor IF-1
MAHQGNIEVEGEVLECLPNTFLGEVVNGHCTCHLSGKMIKLYSHYAGRQGKLEMTPYDATKGRSVSSQIKHMKVRASVK